LLRRLFALACEMSGQIVTYQKMVGQLQDAGNTTTLAHYLDLLAGSGLVVGIPKYAGNAVRKRASSPKLAVLNTGLMSAMASTPFDALRADPARWGRWVESAVGAHLLHGQLGTDLRVYYWREGDAEVDFVLALGDRLLAIEVKSGRVGKPAGLDAFMRAWPQAQPMLVGDGGIALAHFLLTEPVRWFDV